MLFVVAAACDGGACDCFVVMGYAFIVCCYELLVLLTVLVKTAGTLLMVVALGTELITMSAVVVVIAANFTPSFPSVRTPKQTTNFPVTHIFYSSGVKRKMKH